LAACLLAIPLTVFSGRILWALGAILVDSEQPVKADIAVVLGGDWSGNRVLKAAELVREGYAPKLLISSGPYFYGRPESEIAADFAASRGYDRSTMICVQQQQFSTAGETRTIDLMLREMGVRSALLVTSPSHSARAARLFRKAMPTVTFHPVAAPDPRWCEGRWWTSRECQKTWFYETVKTVTSPFGL
jgi:uncharacterized SAM-binding protein YcdF (DUF218 family)